MGKKSIVSLPMLTLVSTLALISCSTPKSVEASGPVKYWSKNSDSLIAKTAESLPGINFMQVASDASWELPETETPDLVFSELAYDFFHALDSGLIYDLASLEPSAPFLKSLYRGIKATHKTRIFTQAQATNQSGTDTAGLSFIPAAGLPWGLFYSTAALEKGGLRPPADWKALLKSFDALKKAGVTPIAIGSVQGWSALAWLAYIDLRLNGYEAYVDLLEGRMNFDDTKMLAVYSTLADWRDAGYFGNPRPESWSEATSSLIRSSSGFALAPASFKARFTTPRIGFMSVPDTNSIKESGDLANVWGYFVPAAAANPRGATAVAAHYIGLKVPGLTSTGYLRPLSYKKAAKTQTGNEAMESSRTEEDNYFISLEDALLSKSAALCPPLDKIFTPQAAYDAGRAMKLFLGTGSTMSPVDLGRVLAELRPVKRIIP